MEIDEVTILSSEPDSPPPKQLDSDEEFPKLKLSDICRDTRKSRGKKSERLAESDNSSDSHHSSWSEISRTRKANRSFEPEPSTSKNDVSYNTRQQLKKRRSNCESPIDLCDQDDEPLKKAAEPSFGNKDDIVLISDGSSSNSRLPEKWDFSDLPQPSKEPYGFSNCFPKFRDSGHLSPIGSLNFEENAGRDCSPTSPVPVVRNSRKTHEISESDDSGDESAKATPVAKLSTYLNEGLASDSALARKTPILPLEDEETRLPSDEDSRNSICSKSTVGSLPASDAVPVESASQMPIGELDASCQSDSTLPPDFLEENVDVDSFPFDRYSDPVTYSEPSPSKDDYGYSQDMPSPAKSDPNLSCYNISEVDTQALPNSEPLTQNGRTKNSRLRKSPKSRSNAAAERQRQKELKLQEKAEKAAVAEALRRMRPGECMKYVTAVFDSGITSNNKWAGKVLENLQNGGTIRTEVTISADPYSIRWLRDQAGNNVATEEKHILFLWSTDQLFTSIQFNTLLDQFTDVKRKYDNYKVYLAIYGLRNHYKYQQRAAKKRAESLSQASQVRNRKPHYDIEEDRVDMELIALQLRLGISHKLVDSVQDVESFIQELTKSIAEIPYKLEREKSDMERNWYAKGDSRNCVRIDKEFNGLNQLWLQQLSQFNNSSLDTAKAIAELYPTPLALYNAYQECSSKAEKEQMLQDITVKRGPGGAGRRLGPELSRKISILFCQTGDISLG